MVSYAGIVSIVSLVYYVPVIACSTILASRHGFGRSSGWIFLVILGFLRITGDSLQLASEQHPRSIGLYTGAAICSSIGLAPLLVTTIGLVLRVNSLVTRRPASNNTQRALIACNLPLIVATILAIVGGVQASNSLASTGVFTLNTIFKAGIVLFAVAYVGIAGSAVIVAARAKSADIDVNEKRLAFAVVLALPVLLVRLIYAFLFSFAHNPKFSLIGGDETIQLCMQMIEEWIVVFIYLASGMMLKRLANPKPTVDGGETGGKSNQSPVQRQRQGWVRHLRYIPLVHWFVR